MVLPASLEIVIFTPERPAPLNVTFPLTGDVAISKLTPSLAAPVEVPERLAGVKVVTADRIKKEARVTLEGAATSPDQIVAAIQGAGKFQAKLAG
jgi:hypothetical protein